MKEFWFKSLTGLFCMLALSIGPGLWLAIELDWNLTLAPALIGVTVAAIRRGAWIVIENQSKVKE